MPVLAVAKCNLCGEIVELLQSVGNPGYRVMPPGWAKVTPYVIISGSRVKAEKSKAFRDRREKLRDRLPAVVYCPDCVEEIIAGKISVKIADMRAEVIQ